MSANISKAAQLLLDGINFVLTHPENHNQGTWMELDALVSEGDIVTVEAELYDNDSHLFDTDSDIEAVGTFVAEPDCGTKGCLAGWIVTLNKDPIVVQRAFEEEPEYEPVYVVVDGKMTTISDRAASLLGIAPRIEHELFRSDNTRGALRRMAVDLLNTGDLAFDDSEAFAHYWDQDEYEAELDDQDITYPPITYDNETGEYK